jgi:hypothetical protein
MVAALGRRQIRAMTKGRRLRRMDGKRVFMLDALRQACSGSVA